MEDWPAEEIMELYRAGGWWNEDYDPSGIAPLIKGSFDFVVAVKKETGKAVGMGRTISDGVSDGYIQDLVVLEDHRGKGIGSLMAEELVKEGRRRGLVWIGLIAEKGSSEFYRRLGFRCFDGEPMLYFGEGP